MVGLKAASNHTFPHPTRRDHGANMGCEGLRAESQKDGYKHASMVADGRDRIVSW